MKTGDWFWTHKIF